MAWNTHPGPISSFETDVVLAFEGGRRLYVKGRISPSHLAHVAQALDTTC